MLKLSTSTWVRFAIWMIIGKQTPQEILLLILGNSGLAIYFFYGIWNSNERMNREQQPSPTINDDTGDEEENRHKKANDNHHHK